MLTKFSQQEGTEEELLRAMEMVEAEDDLGKDETLTEGQVKLDNEIVDKIIIDRSMEPQMGVCEHKKKKKQESWGPVLVERHRRVQDKGGSMMHKAMALKQKRNLEQVKGNPFSVL
jgi:hypothetical protein